MNERAAVGNATAATRLGLADGSRLTALVQHLGQHTDPLVRQDLIKILVNFRVADLTGRRARAKEASGQPPGPEMSIGKLAYGHNLNAVADFVGRVLGPRLIADSGEWGTYAWTQFVLGAPGYRIAGGTDEVMHNIIGERVLGLPKEPIVEAEIPSRSSKQLEPSQAT
jgi:alkylation response protein AidB-like acyl-CoA dehydrogenase